MFNARRNKYDEKYVKHHYITRYKIDEKNKKIFVYYIDGKVVDYPLKSKFLDFIKREMKTQYNEWQPILKQAHMFNFIKLLYINNHLKKQKYYLDHEDKFNNFVLKNKSMKRSLSKAELKSLKTAKDETHSYFNLSSVADYKWSTMRKVWDEISTNERSSK